MFLICIVMPYCSCCGNIINDDTLFCPKCGNRVGVVLNVQWQQFQSFSQQEQKPFKPNSNMAFAILSTCLCCVPTGVYAIVLASKVDRLYYTGEYEKAEMVAADAKKWSIVGMVISLTFWIVYIIIVIIFGVIGGAAFWDGFFNAL